MSPEKGLLENDNSSSNHQFSGDMQNGVSKIGAPPKKVSIGFLQTSFEFCLVPIFENNATHLLINSLLLIDRGILTIQGVIIKKPSKTSTKEPSSNSRNKIFQRSFMTYPPWNSHIPCEIDGWKNEVCFLDGPAFRGKMLVLGRVFLFNLKQK